MLRRLRTFWLMALPLAAVLGACSEDLQTGGGCPILCPGQGFEIRDTIIDGIIVLDSNLVGFPFQGSEDPLLLAFIQDTLDVRVVARYDSLGRAYRKINQDTISPITALDSAYVEVLIAATAGMPTPAQWFIDAYDVYDAALDDTIPTNLLPHFSPARLIGTYQGDTAFTDTLRLRIPIDTAYLRDLLATPNRRLRVGLQVRAASSVQFRMQSSDAGGGPMLTYVAIAYDSTPDPDTIVRTRIVAPVNSLTPVLPSALGSDLGDFNIIALAPNMLSGSTISVGGLPGSRAYLQFNLPLWLTDSVGVLRAELRLVQIPTGGPSSGDSLRLDGHMVLANNPGLSLHRAATLLSNAGVFMASKWFTPSASDTVLLNINALVRQWSTANTGRALPTAFILRTAHEGATPAALRFHSSEAVDPALRPRLRVSYTLGKILGQP